MRCTFEKETSFILQIHINVQDVNDNQPLFAPSSLRAVLYEDKPINSFVHQLLGYDDDLGIVNCLKILRLKTLFCFEI